MSQEKIDILERSLKREKAARKSAEKILEDKSRDLHFLSDELKATNSKLENLLHEKSSQLKGVFENIIDAFVVIDLWGNVIKFNDAATLLFGYNIDIEALNILSLIYVEDMEYAKTSFTDLQIKGFFKNYKARVYTKSNGVKWVHINASIIYDKDKNPIAAQGIVRDITKERTSKEKLIESENRLSTLVLNLNSGIILEDENRKIVLSNTKFCELLDRDMHPDDLFGLDITLLSEQNKNLVKNPELFVEGLREIVEKKVAVFGAQIEMIDGKVIGINYTPIILDGKSKGFLWTFTDITLEKKYNLSLEAQKLKFSSIIANMNLGLVEVNNDDEILLINQSFLDMSGYSEEELLGEKANRILFKEKGDNIILQQNKQRLTGDSNSYELKVKNKNNEFKHWLVSAAPSYNLLGDIVGSIGIHLDITALKNLELQKELILRELEISNNQLHEYAHIVSHDLKSPLRSIDALVSWIKADNVGKFDKITTQNFQLLDTTLETMEKLISNVLKYSSAGSKAKEKEKDIDLNSTVSDLKNMLLIPDNISIKVLNKLPTVQGDKTKFQQLFQNLLSNAIKFCDKENGIIEINYVDNNTFHQFSIKDNGIGIPKKYHDKIFQIFHSLNERKDSTGVGLSIVKKIINLHEGDIWLESEPNVGTTFYFTIKKLNENRPTLKK
ncbi:MAG: PAS domain S-box-containing protein [Polaribacter sp.]|jgi:PAS domain S-box-containing protein|tara:strand:+ start:2851 stop:4863 length:2013 start_codon:yes stop_codon:yes gene_type:complete